MGRLNMLLKGQSSGLIYPPSIVANGLQLVYDQRLSGTGPRTTPTKTIAANSAELTGLGATIGSDYIEFAAGCTVSGFDFTGSNHHHWIWGSGDVIYEDCKFDYGSRGAVGSAVGANTKPASTAKAVYNYCDIDAATTYIFYGGATASYSRLRNGSANYWQTPQQTTPIHLTWDHNYVTGGGYNLSAGTHVEHIQHYASGTMMMTNNIIDITDTALIDFGAVGPGTGWTAILAAVGASGLTTTVSNNIFLGLKATYDAFVTRKILNAIVYEQANAATTTFTNNVCEIGGVGFIGAGSPRPVDGGNNRDFFTGALISPL